MARNDKEKLLDCVITYGERDLEHYRYKEGTIGREVVKHNVTRKEALAWYGSSECMKRVQELKDLGREKFGKDHWIRWGVSYFWTNAAED